MRKFERSEGSATAFCRKHKLSSQSLRRWQRALQQTEPARESAQFLELEVEPQRPEPSRAGVQPAVELVLGGGMVLRIYRGHSQQQ